jgi:hypothetical protein
MASATTTITMRCKKSRHTLTLAQRLAILRQGYVYVYAAGVKPHATIVVSPVDADIDSDRTILYADVSRISLWRLGQRILSRGILAHPRLSLTLCGTVLVTAWALVLAHC